MEELTLQEESNIKLKVAGGIRAMKKEPLSFICNVSWPQDRILSYHYGHTINKIDFKGMAFIPLVDRDDFRDSINYRNGYLAVKDIKQIKIWITKRPGGWICYQVIDVPDVLIARDGNTGGVPALIIGDYQLFLGKPQVTKDIDLETILTEMDKIFTRVKTQSYYTYEWEY